MGGGGEGATRGLGGGEVVERARGRRERDGGGRSRSGRERRGCGDRGRVGGDRVGGGRLGLIVEGRQDHPGAVTEGQGQAVGAQGGEGIGAGEAGAEPALAPVVDEGGVADHGVDALVVELGVVGLAAEPGGGAVAQGDGVDGAGLAVLEELLAGEAEAVEAFAEASEPGADALAEEAVQALSAAGDGDELGEGGGGLGADVGGAEAASVPSVECGLVRF